MTQKELNRTPCGIIAQREMDIWSDDGKRRKQVEYVIGKRKNKKRKTIYYISFPNEGKSYTRLCYEDFFLMLLNNEEKAEEYAWNMYLDFLELSRWVSQK